MEIIIKCSDDCRGNTNIYGEPITEIVRCRDCAYKIFLQDEQIYKCKQTLHRFYDTDHFCSYGRRADDER